LTITLNNIGKKFGAEWIFKNLSYEIFSEDKLVILGGNGSGKSTLLQLISGFVSPNKGEIAYQFNGEEIKADELKKYISFASPYIQLIEDFTLTEMIEHAAKFKPFFKGFNSSEIIEVIELSHAKNKPIKQFSSGMKQRLKLGLAILADTPLLLLDEPTSNLDKNAIDWYKKIINLHTNSRSVIVCSNALEAEYFFCEKQFNVGDFKK
jgi:ABC-type multidrug transport system ATPase subunit